MTKIHQSIFGRVATAIAAALIALAIVFPATAAHAETSKKVSGSCGQKIAIVIDTSPSMYGNDAYVIDATDHLLDALNGTASYVGFYSTKSYYKDELLPQMRLLDKGDKPFSTRNTASVDKAKAAFSKWFSRSFSDDSSAEPALKWMADGEYDQIFFITDGILWEWVDQTNGNRLKASGTTLSMIVVESELSYLDEYALRVPTSEKHIFTAESYEKLTAPLKNIVAADCKATINITNHLAKGVKGNVGNWKFAVGDTPAVTDETGYVSLKTGVVADKGEKVTVTQDAPDYTITDVKCKISDGAAIPTTFKKSSFDLKVAKDDIVICDVTNSKSEQTEANPQEERVPKTTRNVKLNPKQDPKTDPKPDTKQKSAKTKKPDPKPVHKPKQKLVKNELAHTGAQTKALFTAALIFIALGWGFIREVSARTS